MSPVKFSAASILSASLVSAAGSVAGLLVWMAVFGRPSASGADLPSFLLTALASGMAAVALFLPLPPRSSRP